MKLTGAVAQGTSDGACRGIGFQDGTGGAGGIEEDVARRGSAQKPPGAADDVGSVQSKNTASDDRGASVGVIAVQTEESRVVGGREGDAGGTANAIANSHRQVVNTAGPAEECQSARSDAGKGHRS